ncbi:MAG: four helix bundle protein, partial [Vicinamibacterales bacterium]
MGVRRLEDLVAWQLADSFKNEVYRLVRASPSAAGDFAYRDQLRQSAASVGMNVGEGFYRFGRREFVRFLSIALGSLGEATLWLQDGVQRGHFRSEDCAEAFALSKRCRGATLRLLQSLSDKR